MELIELATQLLHDGHTIVVREEADGTTEVTAYPLEAPPRPVRPSRPSTKEKPDRAPAKKHTTSGRGKGTHMSPDDLKKIKKMRASGMTYPAISEATGWSESTIAKRIRG